MSHNDPKDNNNNVDDSESIASDESEEMIGKIEHIKFTIKTLLNSFFVLTFL